MKTHERKHILWLLKELPVLSDAGLIDTAASQKLSEHYTGKLAGAKPSNLLTNTLAIIAALFVLGGTILLLAYNWSDMGKPLKTVLAMLVLIIPLALSAVYLARAKDQTRWGYQEGLGLAWALGFGVTLALIGQIYQLPSQTEPFVLLWAASTLAVLYIMNSLAVAALYLVLITVWVSLMQIGGGVGYLFLPALALVVPHYIISYRQSLVRRTVYHYFLMAALVTGLGISLEKNIPGMWMVVYGALLSVFYLYSHVLESRNAEQSLFYYPMRIAGTLGTAVLTYLLAWKWPWEYIGWKDYRDSYNFHSEGMFYDIGLTALLVLATAALLVPAFLKRRRFNPVLAVTGLFIAGLYLLTASGIVGDGMPPVLMNFFIFILTVSGLFLGFKEKSMMAVNLNMLYLTLMILTRFLDDEMGLMARGLAFIVCGVLIFVINKFVLSRMKKEERPL